MERTFEETRQFAADNLAKMDRQLGRLQRTHRNYLRHGAVNAAAELMLQIEKKEREICSEESLFGMAFN